MSGSAAVDAAAARTGLSGPLLRRGARLWHMYHRRLRLVLTWAVAAIKLDAAQPLWVGKFRPIRIAVLGLIIGAAGGVTAALVARLWGFGRLY